MTAAYEFLALDQGLLLARPAGSNATEQHPDAVRIVNVDGRWLIDWKSDVTSIIHDHARLSDAVAAFAAKQRYR